jgi:hypothetical protein
VLFIGTRFSILYTSMYSTAGAVSSLMNQVILFLIVYGIFALATSIAAGADDTPPAVGVGPKKKWVSPTKKRSKAPYIP